MFEDFAIQPSDYRNYPIDALLNALLNDPNNFDLLFELERRNELAIEKHLAGQHDQSTHGHHTEYSSLSPLKLPNSPMISENNLVSSSLPHVGLSAKAQEVASRIYAGDAPETKVVEQGPRMVETMMKREGTYTLEDGSKVYLTWTSTKIDTGKSQSLEQIVEVIKPKVGYVGSLEIDSIYSLNNDAKNDSEKFSIISAVYVDKDLRGQGLATAMLEYARLNSPEPIFHSSDLSEEGANFAAATKSLAKHQAGKHDQSTHAPQKRKGVPAGIDLENKRYSEEAIAELRKKVWDFSDARHEAHEQAVAAMKAGKTTEESKKLYRESFDSNEKLKQAREALEENYLYKDAMNLRDANGVRLGDKEYAAQGESPADYLMRMGTGGERLATPAEFSKDAQFYDNEMNERAAGVRVTAEEAAAVATADWQEWASSADSVIIMPQSKLNQVLASGRVKTVHETGVSTVGANTEDYIDHRLIYENMAFGYDNSTPVEARPVSGILMSDNYHPTDAVAFYGGSKPAEIILKPELQERTTWTANDSLNTFGQARAVDATAFPANYTALQAAVWRKATGENYFASTNFRNKLTEVQVHGGIKTGDIGKVRFFTPPSASVVAKLDRLDIPYEVVEEGIMPN